MTNRALKALQESLKQRFKSLERTLSLAVAPDEIDALKLGKFLGTYRSFHNHRLPTSSRINRVFIILTSQAFSKLNADVYNFVYNTANGTGKRREISQCKTQLRPLPASELFLSCDIITSRYQSDHMVVLVQ